MIAVRFVPGWQLPVRISPVWTSARWFVCLHPLRRKMYRSKVNDEDERESFCEQGWEKERKTHSEGPPYESLCRFLDRPGLDFGSHRASFFASEAVEPWAFSPTEDAHFQKKESPAGWLFVSLLWDISRYAAWLDVAKNRTWSWKLSLSSNSFLRCSSGMRGVNVRLLTATASRQAYLFIHVMIKSF